MNVYHETQLAWPKGKLKTPQDKRKNGQFKTTLANALSRVEAAVRAFSGKVWRTKSLTIYLDGGELGSRNAFLGRSRFRSPAVSVEFDLDGKTYCLATDNLTTPEQALCGIAVAIEGIRAQERYGIFTAEEMLQGLSALPPVSTWRDILGNPKTLEQAENMYRELAKSAHPDAGGSHDAMTKLNSAIQSAREFLA